MTDDPEVSLPTDDTRPMHSLSRGWSEMVRYGDTITTVRLDLEKNKLLRVAGKIGLKADRCKAHEIWVFSKTERICRQVLREASSGVPSG
jgi:hypothetical protein